MNKPVVLVHGAFHGSWCWERVTPHLDAAGVTWIAPDLPSCAQAATGAALQEDVDVVRAALDELPGEEPAIMLGHSRGGAVITEAGAHKRVGSLVYLTALLLDDGEEATDHVSADLPNAIRLNDDGSISVNSGWDAEMFYNDCTEDDVAWASGQLRSQNLALDIADSERAWTVKPSIYVVCTRDKAIPLASQQTMAGRVNTTIEWDTGHSPFLNRPDLVAALLVGLSKG